MSRILEGEKHDYDDPVLMMWREYRLARLFGWTPDQMDDVSGEWVDWALQIDREFGRG